MTIDNPHFSTLFDVDPGLTRTLQVNPRPYLAPDNAARITAVYYDHVTGESTFYPVDVKREDLLAALGALGADETGYRGVVAENNRLGWELAAAIADRDAAERERDSALEALRDAAEAPEDLTARDHLDAAWEAAYVPEDGVIPAKSEYIVKYPNGRISGPSHSPTKVGAHGTLERRLLAPPTPPRPPRPEGAKEIERLLTEGLGDFSPPATPEAIADLLAVRGVRAPTNPEEKR